jgi:hypothetical protein
MINVVMDELPLCFCNGLLDGVKLLGKVKACSAFRKHRDDSPHVPLGALEPLDDIRMAFVNMSFLHDCNLSTGNEYGKDIEGYFMPRIMRIGKGDRRSAVISKGLTPNTQRPF